MGGTTGPINQSANAATAGDAERQRQKDEEQRKRAADDAQLKLHQDAYRNLVADKFAKVDWTYVGEQAKQADADMNVKMGHDGQTNRTGIIRREGFKDFHFNAETNAVTFLSRVDGVKDIHNAMDFLAKQGVGECTLDWSRVEDVDLDIVRQVLRDKLKDSPTQSVTLGDNVRKAINETARYTKDGQIPKEWAELLELEQKLAQKYNDDPLVKAANQKGNYDDMTQKMRGKDGPADDTNAAKDAWKDRLFENAATPAEKLHAMEQKATDVEERTKALATARDALNEEALPEASESREALLTAVEKEAEKLSNIKATLDAEMQDPSYENVVAQAPANAAQPAAAAPAAAQPDPVAPAGAAQPDPAVAAPPAAGAPQPDPAANVPPAPPPPPPAQPVVVGPAAAQPDPAVVAQPANVPPAADPAAIRNDPALAGQTNTAITNEPKAAPVNVDSIKAKLEKVDVTLQAVKQDIQKFREPPEVTNANSNTPGP